MSQTKKFRRRINRRKTRSKRFNKKKSTIKKTSLKRKGGMLRQSTGSRNWRTETSMRHPTRIQDCRNSDEGDMISSDPWPEDINMNDLRILPSGNCMYERDIERLQSWTDPWTRAPLPEPRAAAPPPPPPQGDASSGRNRFADIPSHQTPPRPYTLEDTLRMQAARGEMPREPISGTDQFFTIRETLMREIARRRGDPVPGDGMSLEDVLDARARSIRDDEILALQALYSGEDATAEARGRDAIRRRRDLARLRRCLSLSGGASRRRG